MAIDLLDLWLGQCLNLNAYCVSFEHLAVVPTDFPSVKVSGSFLKALIESVFPHQSTSQSFFSPGLSPMKPSHYHSRSLLFLLQIIVSYDMVSYGQEFGYILLLSRTESSREWQNISKK